MSWNIKSSYDSLYAHRKCLIICAVVAVANMQYGFDSSGVGALQAMPGFLKVFGFEDPSLPLGYGIDVSLLRTRSSFSLLYSGCRIRVLTRD